MKKGVLITLEGNEGCGKSTQIKLLEKWFKKKGRSVYVTREPGGTPVGDEIRTLLLNPRHAGMSPICETLLYMASRAQLVEKVIAPKLRQGQIVLCDRWMDATLAYQGYAGEADVDWIRAVGAEATRGVKPVLSLYLDLPVALGLKRARTLRGPDRIEQKPLSYHENVRKGFLRIAKEEPLRFRRLVIGDKETIEHVQERLRSEIERVL